MIRYKRYLRDGSVNTATFSICSNLKTKLTAVEFKLKEFSRKQIINSNHCLFSECKERIFTINETTETILRCSFSLFSFRFNIRTEYDWR